jgi:hypothetical protein
VPDAIKHLSITLPSPLPFDGIAFEPRQSMRYRSNIDAAKLTRAAQEELASHDRPVFLAFLLALGAGPRRIEIDRLEWRAPHWNHNVIRIEPTQYFDVKTEHSIGDVSIDPELISVFRGYAARAASNFVIETENLPIADAGHPAEIGRSTLPVDASSLAAINVNSDPIWTCDGNICTSAGVLQESTCAWLRLRQDDAGDAGSLEKGKPGYA